MTDAQSTTDTLTRETVLAHVARIINYFKGRGEFHGCYGQSGFDPKPIEGMSRLTHDLLWRLAHDGHKAALARQDHDEARAAWHTETVVKCRGMLKRACGCVDAQEIFSMGYKAAGKG